MAGAGISGKDGDVKIGTTSICEIRKWSFNPKSNNPSYASNKTAGYKRRVAGVKDGSGSMEGAWDPATPAVAVIDVGTDVTLKLYINATQFYSVPAVIDSFKVDVDVDGGEIISWSSDFATNGAWTNPVAGMTLPAGEVPPPANPNDPAAGPSNEWQFTPNAPLQSDGAVQEGPAPVVPEAAIKQIVEAVKADFAELFASVKNDIESLRAEMSKATDTVHADPQAVV